MLKNILANAWRKPAGATQPASPGPIPAGERVVVFTTVHAEGFTKYGERFLESFLRFWPSQYELWIYGEGFTLQPPPRVKFLDLDAEIPALSEFKKRHALNRITHGQVGSGYDYRFDAVRFANKSFVMCDVFRKRPSQYALWLDADTVAFQPLPADFMPRILADGEFMAYLGRMGMHSETGFLPFDLGHPGAGKFFETLEAMYRTDSVFTLSEWHDCEAIDAIRTTLRAQGVIDAKNLNAFGANHPFVNSVAGLFMDHMKGPTRKDAKQSKAGDFVIPPYSRVNFMGGRYGQLPGLLRQIMPSTIVEVGTWSGWRAVQMALIPLSVGRSVHYRGYDVFEQFSAEFDSREMNVKPHFSKTEVTRLLSLLGGIYPEFTFELVQGDTNETLKHEKVDFVFLDGGHSVATIQSDYDAVRGSDFVLLDDYYSGPIDTVAFGCNAVIAKERTWLLPQKDPVAGGGFTQFALTSSLADAPDWTQGLNRIS